MTTTKTFTLDELCTLSDTPRRTVRYYIQLGLVDRPIGETRAAHYGARHLEQLLKIRQFTEAGVSLDEIVRAVNQVGAAPGDLVAILEALKEAGALRAELLVI